MLKKIFLIFIVFIFLFLINSSVTLASGKGFWSTQGNKIVDQNGKEVIIRGVNWGLEVYSEKNGFNLYGTNKNYHEGNPGPTYKEILNRIKNFGFNTIRFTYSNDHLKPDCVYKDGDGKNPELNKLTCLEVIDKAIEYAGVLGLRIILDRHRTSLGLSGENALWYTSEVSEGKMIDDWKMLAKRYKNNPNIIGADLANEPNYHRSCWGCGNPSVDWRSAAERIGNAILSVNPNWLIFVEGLVGEELVDAGNYPVRLSRGNKLVYSVHIYPGVTHGLTTPEEWITVWDQKFGYLVKNNIAPVLVGEYAPDYAMSDSSKEKWLGSFVNYLKEKNISATYWSWRFETSGNYVANLIKQDYLNVNSNRWISYVKGINFPLENNSVSTPTVTPTNSNTKKGDANGDGQVDGLDYVVWLNHYSQNTNKGAGEGDFNGDGQVDGLDYVIWVNNAL
ncbi:cellulase family glycosylhydrolase [Candidatus Microgenomates bacterium]|nr:cellulase family glycosylhydrolase [Candidatus Microgenomates bacterium]